MTVKTASRRCRQDGVTLRCQHCGHGIKCHEHGTDRCHVRGCECRDFDF